MRINKLQATIIYPLLISFVSQQVFAQPLFASDRFLTSELPSSIFEPQQRCPLPMPDPENPNPGTGAPEEAVNQRSYRDCCDPRFVLGLFDPRPTFPITAKKVGIWTAYAVVISGVVVAALFGYLDFLPEAFKYNSFIVLGFVYGLEPLMMLYNLSVGKYPPPHPTLEGDPADLEAQVKNSFSEQTALIIPCHNSAKEIVATLTAALKHFEPQHIFIMDNGNTPAPTDNTEELVHQIDPRINYIWSPIGNKSVAEYVGCLAANQYKYILMIDDDVILPPNFRVPVDLLNDQLVHAVSFGISAVDKNGKRPWFVGCQDIEYKFSDSAKLAEDRLFGVQYPHGASSVWNRETLIKVLRNHNLLFFTEDVKLGVGLQKLGKRMAFDARVVLDTEVPTSVFGTPPNYWKQREYYWELGRHLITFDFLWGVFAINRDIKLFASEMEYLKAKKGVTALPIKDVAGLFAKTICFMIPKKAVQLYTVAGNVADWVRIPLIVVMATDPTFWATTAGFMCFPLIPILFWKMKLWASNRQDLDTAPWTSVLGYPAYKLIYSAASEAGLFRLLLIDLTNRKKMKKIPQMEAENDPRCIWLKAEFRERFGLPLEEEGHLDRAAFQGQSHPEIPATELNCQH